MQKPRRRALLVMRKFLTCTMCSMALVAVLSVPVQVFPSSRDVPIFSRSYKLPKRLVPEQSLTQEFAPLRWSKAPRLFHKTSALDDLWNPPSNRDFFPCTEPSLNYSSPGKTRGYLLVHTNGGLNQMRAGICDMVAIARIINATLVIPELDKHSFWNDSSNFSDIFDEDHFINALSNDVKVIKKLPKEFATIARAVKHFRSWSGIDYYRDEIASMWKDHRVIRAAKSDSRLANNYLPADIQKLRCRACYEALRFSPQIEAMGKVA
ncbi:O-fucosyltransferase 7-like isoform X2 [Benincasa hispida]|uniref:O-fucosyltransferase 7-like isoform X2 n=1 Tax=Benincasa hispida TaxID=102211 RepID=UPI001901C616|nr:O-fucosyltransferase 7-like isoform X2 [Benincasa hispida]